MDYTKKPIGGFYANEASQAWYRQRSEEIYKDKESRVSNATLVAKYGISLVAIQKIYNRERSKHEFRNTK